jgi:hypothetical protein
LELLSQATKEKEQIESSVPPVPLPDLSILAGVVVSQIESEIERVQKQKQKTTETTVLRIRLRSSSQQKPLKRSKKSLSPISEVEDNEESFEEEIQVDQTIHTLTNFNEKCASFIRNRVTPISLPSWQPTTILGGYIPKGKSQVAEMKALISFYLKNEKVESDLLVRSVGGGVLFAYFRKIVPFDMLKQMEEATSKLGKDQSPSMRKQGSRGSGNFYLFGYRKKSNSVEPYSFNDNHLKWCEEMNSYFALIRELVKVHFADSDKFYCSSVTSALEFNPFAPFTAVQLNYLTVVGKHYDQNDYPESLGCLTTVGKYTGGELLLHDFDLKIVIQPGDVFFYQASRLVHSVCETTGERSSINLFCNKWLLKMERLKLMQQCNSLEN